MELDLTLKIDARALMAALTALTLFAGVVIFLKQSQRREAGAQHETDTPAA